jgi:hypothetical protein
VSLSFIIKLFEMRLINAPMPDRGRSQVGQSAHAGKSGGQLLAAKSLLRGATDGLREENSHGKYENHCDTRARL